MSAPAPVVTIQCRKGSWTIVTTAFTLIFGKPLTYHYRVSPASLVHWRFFSAGIPPLWGGAFIGDAYITLPPVGYTWVEFYPDEVTVDVAITTY